MPPPQPRLLLTIRIRGDDGNGSEKESWKPGNNSCLPTRLGQQKHGLGLDGELCVRWSGSDIRGK